MNTSSTIFAQIMDFLPLLLTPRKSTLPPTVKIQNALLNKKMIKSSGSGGQTYRGTTAHTIFVDADGIYVVIADKNKLEILLYNENGDSKEYYFKNLEAGMGLCWGLFVKKSPSGKRFFILRSLPYPGIEELIPYK